MVAMFWGGFISSLQACRVVSISTSIVPSASNLGSAPIVDVVLGGAWADR